MSNRVPLSGLINAWTQIKGFEDVLINNIGSDLEFKFTSSDIEEIVSFFELIGVVREKGDTFFTIKRKNESQQIIFFKDLNSLFSSIRNSNTILNSFDFFVFDNHSNYLYYDCITKKINSNSTFQYTGSILDHYLSYSKLLDVFKSNQPRLIELDRPLDNENELIILSKGTENFITNIKYRLVDESIFNGEFLRVPLEEFKLKLINDEWVSSFKNVLCNYMELQNESLKTFSTVYKNLTYLYNQTNKNYDLFVSKFSFDKIRKQFKTEKNAYFDSLNNAQDKITAQIISIPISLGASIFSFYQLTTAYSTIILVYFAIFIYSFFITFVVWGYLKDVNKLASDVNEEQENLKTHFSELMNDFKNDFKFMKSKRRYIRFVGWSIITSLVTTFIAITYYIFHIHQDPLRSPFYFI